MTTTAQPRASARLILILLAFVGFIALGLPDGLLGVAWPTMRAYFGQPLDALGLLLLSGISGYLLSSFFAGRLMARLGPGGLLAVSCAATGMALLGNTLVPAWWMMLPLGLLSGLGAGAIDSGLNTYVAAHHGEGLMQWLHASWGVGITLGPIIMTTALAELGGWQAGYRIVGVFQLLLALGFLLTAQMWRDGAPAPAGEKRLTEYDTPLIATLRKPGAWAGILLFITYVGVEITLGTWAYSLLTESRGVAPELAGLYTGSYWATFTIGRVLAGLYARRLPIHGLLRGAMALALAGTLLLWANLSDTLSIAGVVLVGFAIAPLYPGMMSTTAQRIDTHHLANAIGMQVSAGGLGSAIMPALAGVLARRISLEVIPPYVALLLVILLALYTVSTRPKVATG
jgi:fucose permease